MGKFIYVFNSAARDKLLEAGFVLLKTDENNSIYVFVNDEKLLPELESADISFIASSTLTF